MDLSPPPTPPSKVPRDSKERRFKDFGTPCEWVEDYHPGSYHPVHLGDVFHNGQYKVIRKLGDGSFSTVWLARDTRNNRYVAIKILISDLSGSIHESQVLRQLMHDAPDEAKHITQLLDEFEHHGPNGIHKCLIFEPMGPSVNSMKSFLTLAFLHENGITHGDFQPGNILFALSNIDSKPEEELRQKDVEAQSISPPIERKDGKQDKWAPRYLCVAQPIVYPNDYARGVTIKLSDMGGAFSLEHPLTKPITPSGLRSPEFVLTGAVNNTWDIWSFGCLVFELITGQPFFCVPWFGSEADTDDNHLLYFNLILGALPDNLYKHWTRSSLYFTPERELYNCNIGGVPDGEEPLMLDEPSMEVMFDQAAPDLQEEEASQVKVLVRRILQYDPARRLSAAELLRDPWFADEVGSDSPSLMVR
ncbi:serine protein kinase [Nemania sp. FL0031]|nr:serine protein kinase [Nemania sp. FL0031]